LFAAAGLALVLLAGCGDEDSSTPSQASAAGDGERESGKKQSGAVTAGETGFGISRSEFSGVPDYLWAVTMVHNGTGQLISPNASFSAYDPSGKVIGQSETSAPVLRAGMDFPLGTQLDVPAGATVAKVIATISPLENLSVKDKSPDSKFSTTGVHFQPDPYSSGEVLGEVVSGYKQDVTQVYVSLVCYNAENAIIGGGDTYVESVGSGQTVGFSTPNLIVSGKPSRCTADATLSGLSEGK